MLWRFINRWMIYKHDELCGACSLKTDRKNSRYYGTQGLIKLHTAVCHWMVPCTSSVQAAASHTISARFKWTLSLMGFPSFHTHLTYTIRTRINFCSFLAASKNCEKRRLASSCLSVCPFVRMEQRGCYWTNFHEIWYLSIFRKYVQKIHVSLKYDENKRYLHEDLCTFMMLSRWILPILWNVSDKICRENRNTYFMINDFFFF